MINGSTLINIFYYQNIFLCNFASQFLFKKRAPLQCPDFFLMGHKKKTQTDVMTGYEFALLFFIHFVHRKENPKQYDNQLHSFSKWSSFDSVIYFFICTNTHASLCIRSMCVAGRILGIFTNWSFIWFFFSLSIFFFILRFVTYFPFAFVTRKKVEERRGGAWK